MVLLVCGGFALWLAGALAGPHESGLRWYWREAALGLSVVLVWSLGRIKRGEGIQARHLLPVVFSLLPLLFALAMAEGLDRRGVLRGSAWMAAVLVASLVWRREAVGNLVEKVTRLTRLAAAAMGRRTVFLALAAFVLCAGVSALRARHGIDPVGPVTGHDSFCYILQARTFLEGRAANPVHPHWEFFQSYHVVTWPFYQAKYPPGYAFTLAAGMAVGLARYVPAILLGLAGLGTFLVGRRLFGPWPAALAVIWLALVPKFSLLGSWHMSNTAAVAVCVWLLHVFLVSREKPGRWWPYVAGGLIVGYFILLRPLDAVLFAGPVLLLWTVSAFRRLHLATAASRIAVLGLMCAGGLVVMALYNHAVTGHALVMPYSVHEREYSGGPPVGRMDIPRLRTEPTQRPHQRWDRFERVYKSTFLPTPLPHRLDMLPARLDLQLGLFGKDVRHAGLLFAALPLALLVGLRRRVGGLLLLAALFWVGYGLSASYCSRYIWPVFPLVALAVMGGASEVLRDVRPGFGWLRTLLPAAVVLFAFSAAFLTPRFADPGMKAHYYHLVQTVETAPGDEKLVFLDYDGWHLGQEYVYNGPDIDEDAIVFAQDLKERNEELMAYYPERHVYVYVLNDRTLSLIRSPVRE